MAVVSVFIVVSGAVIMNSMPVPATEHIKEIGVPKTRGEPWRRPAAMHDGFVGRATPTSSTPAASGSLQVTVGGEAQPAVLNSPAGETCRTWFPVR